MTIATTTLYQTASVIPLIPAAQQRRHQWCRRQLLLFFLTLERVVRIRSQHRSQVGIHDTECVYCVYNGLT